MEIVIEGLARNLSHLDQSQPGTPLFSKYPVCDGFPVEFFNLNYS